uniref:Uncharacterized protein n=1 Tax=Spongospora subterranea TaxID=70186 RepID=A0A0H5R9R1_9EUKA|eukprot:CRZ05169.1 hypothetical protein [Spongospora subterranea]
MDNGKTLGFRGDTDVVCADVVSGGIGVTMMVRLTGGPGHEFKLHFSFFRTRMVLIRSEVYVVSFSQEILSPKIVVTSSKVILDSDSDEDVDTVVRPSDDCI